MDNPCKKCKMSLAEKGACCGCPERLEWERKQKIEKTEGNKKPVLFT